MQHNYVDIQENCNQIRIFKHLKYLPRVTSKMLKAITASKRLQSPDSVINLWWIW